MSTDYGQHQTTWSKREIYDGVENSLLYISAVMGLHNSILKTASGSHWPCSVESLLWDLNVSVAQLFHSSDTLAAKQKRISVLHHRLIRRFQICG